jgi:RNA polymerase sigma-70 factor (ECF subfamily)
MEFRRKSSHRYIHFSDKAFENIISRTDKVIDGMDDRIQALQNCLAKLGERERHLVRIRYEQDITTRSLAERIGEPVDRLYKVMARIHDSLQKCVRRTLAAWEMAR